MAGTPIGRILLMPKGAYNASTTYNALDWVRHGGSAWVCTTDNTVGITPAAGVPQWALLASDGSIGGWGSLAGKPFETLGNGVKKDTDDSLTLNVTTNLLLGSKLDVDVQSTYSASGTKPINGTGVASAISGKADSTDLDEWVTGTGAGDNVVNASGSITFTGINDTANCGYVPYFNIPDGNPPTNPTAELTFMNGSGTSNLSLTYQTNLGNGVAGKLRRLK